MCSSDLTLDVPFVAMFFGFVRGIDAATFHKSHAVIARTITKKSGNHVFAKSSKPWSHWPTSVWCSPGGRTIFTVFVVVVV